MNELQRVYGRDVVSPTQPMKAAGDRDPEAKNAQKRLAAVRELQYSASLDPR